MITESKQSKRLKNYNLSIRTLYFQDNTIRQRNTDNSLNEDITQGVVLKKEYYHNNKLLKTEKVFDSRITYTYKFDGSGKYTCKNCGMSGKISDFEDGCPYCNTNYNVDYEDKNLSNKNYYDLIVKNKGYIVRTYIVDILICLILTSIYIYYTSRTFYFFDILKIIFISILISLVLFYFFYYVDAMILLPSLKRKKEKQNKLQEEFWSRMSRIGANKSKFFNNFNFELRNLYYSDKYKDIIDYDIIDYNKFKEYEKDNKLYVDVNVDIRIARYINGTIKTKLENITYRLQRVSNNIELKGAINYIPCPNCGASIDATKSNCEYCGNSHNYYQEWYLKEVK